MPFHPSASKMHWQTSILHYRQTGLLPVWELEGNETFCMVGNHSIPVIAEAILKGIGDFDHELAFEAMKVTSMHDRDGMGMYDKLGYMPADKIQQSVAKSLEVAIDDWCVAAVAQKLDKTEDATYFSTFRIVKIGHRRIVKRNMSIFTNSNACDINRMRF